MIGIKSESLIYSNGAYITSARQPNRQISSFPVVYTKRKRTYMFIKFFHPTFISCYNKRTHTSMSMILVGKRFGSWFSNRVTTISRNLTIEFIDVLLSNLLRGSIYRIFFKSGGGGTLLDRLSTETNEVYLHAFNNVVNYAR